MIHRLYGSYTSSQKSDSTRKTTDNRDHPNSDLRGNQLWAAGLKERYGPFHKYDQCTKPTEEHLPISSLLNIGNLSQAIMNDLPRYSIDINTDALAEMVEEIPIDEEHLYKIQMEDFGNQQSNPLLEQFFEDMKNDMATGVQKKSYQHRPIKLRKTDISSDGIADIATKKALKFITKNFANITKNTPETSAKTIEDIEQITMSERSLLKSAEKSFRHFIETDFEKYKFGEMGIAKIRFYYITAYMDVIKRGLGENGGSITHDDIASPRKAFKSFHLDSELLRGLKDAPQKYAFLTSLELQYKSKENDKPYIGASIVHPITNARNLRNNSFLQASFTNQNSRQQLSTGLGYRYLPRHHKYTLGANTFIDGDLENDNLRASIGFDAHTRFLSLAANAYKGLSSWRSGKFNIEERALDGADLELALRIPFLPALELATRGYIWESKLTNDNIEGIEAKLRYSPIPSITIEGGLNEETNREKAIEFALRYKYILGAPPSYLYDWNEQFRVKSPAEYIFRPVSRDDDLIRLEER